MNWPIEVWISIIIGIVPIVWGIVKWFWERFYGVKKRALAIEYIDSKQYFHKKNDKLELKVIYNNVTTCDAVVTLRIAIKNTGKEDISKNALIDPIKISFSDKYEILEVVRVNEYEKIKPNIVYTNDVIMLSWALLKHQDQFEVDIIAQNKSVEKERELSVDFYNSLSYDLNIEGVDDISCEKKITAKEKIIINSRKQIAFIVIYAAVLTLCAFLTKSRSDFDYRLILQRDSTCVESLVSIFSKENLVEVDAFEEVLPIEEFNKCYVIGGIPTGLPNRNKVSLIIYTSAAICCYIGTILLLAMHYLKKKKLLGKGKQVNKG